MEGYLGTAKDQKYNNSICKNILSGDKEDRQEVVTVSEGEGGLLLVVKQ